MNYHTVKKGESLWQIANMHNISLQALIDANPQIEDPNEITVGTKILIPDCDDWTIPEPPQNRPNPPGNRPDRPERPQPPTDGDQMVEGDENDIENEEMEKIQRSIMLTIKENVSGIEKIIFVIQTDDKSGIMNTIMISNYSNSIIGE